MPRAAPPNTIPALLQFNCGFARCAVKEITAQLAAEKVGKAARDVSVAGRTERFNNLFGLASFGIPNGFMTTTSHRPPLFEARCEAVLDAFKAKWRSQCKRQDYLMTFTIQRWRKLSAGERASHSLQNCMGCALQHPDLQAAFPGPTFTPPSLDSMYKSASTTRKGEKEMTRRALQHVNTYHEKTYGHSLTQSVVALCSEVGVQQKPTANEVRTKRRKRDRLIRDTENTKLAKIVPRQILSSSNASISAYLKRRREQHLERPQQPGRVRSHSPAVQNQHWNVSEALDMLRNWPNDDVINWSAEARKLGVPGDNCGQVLKDTAQQHGINTIALDGQSGRRIRGRKRRLPGSDVSVGCAPSKRAVKSTWEDMLQSGEVLIGEACAPYKITRVRHGTEQITETITGRKIPLLDIRKQSLEDHFKYMRLSHKDSVLGAGRAELETLVGCGAATMTDNELRQHVDKHIALRHFAVWHDHSTICGCGYIMVTCKEVYNSLVHYTSAEYKALTGEVVDIQSQVERPYLHILAAGSSSAADHVAFTADRVDCLKDFTTTLQAQEGIEVTDILRFFNGDKVAQWMEGGCQLGGNYKCGSCGVLSDSFIDSAHCNQATYRSISDIQAHVLAGIHGGKRLCVKPFSGLSVQEVRQELAARKLDTTGKSKEIRQRLVEHLGGLQRVPMLLLTNPKANLKVLNLENYAINDFEPLHAIKGHIINVFAELPNILPDNIKGDVEQLLSACLRKEKVTGADLRAAAIVLFKFLSGKVTSKIETLIETIVRIGELSYLAEHKRTPRVVLQLYNCTWYHHELLQTLIPHPRSITRQKLFGSYLHDISCHAAPQYELVCLRSCNTEYEERLFGQVKRVAESCTNRKPQNVLVQAFIRLQLLLTQGHVKVKETKVVRAAKRLKTYTGTCISKDFVQTRMRSWQTHLKRISNYLSRGEGVWWTQTDSHYHFLDGEQHPESHLQGPPLLHFWSTSQKQLCEVKSKHWDDIIENQTTLPAPYVQLYDEQGIPTDKVFFSSTCASTSTQDLTTSPTNHSEPTFVTSTPMATGLTPLMQITPITIPSDQTPTSMTSTEGEQDTSDESADNAEQNGVQDFLRLALQDNDPDATIEVNISEEAEVTDSEDSPLQSHKSDDTGSSMEVGNNCEEAAVTDEDSPSQLHSSHSRLIFSILGSSQGLTRYDQLRRMLKDGTSLQDADCRRQHDRLLAGLQTQVLNAHSSLVSQLKDFEQGHLQQTGVLPVSLPPEWENRRRMIKRCKALLRMWTIAL